MDEKRMGHTVETIGDEYSRDFRILDLSKANDKAFAMSLFPESSKTSASLRRATLENCRYLVLEDNYIDLNFRSGFSRIYHLRHQDTVRRCRRLHLFGKDLRDLTPALLRSGAIDYSAHYRGFVVFRPKPLTGIARCVLSTKLMPSKVGSDDAFLTCTALFRANLAGDNVRFEGCPWLEQDGLTSSCATAAIWTVNTHYWAKHWPDFRRYYTWQISEMATRYDLTLGRSLPNKGLTSPQMMHALQQMGYEPTSYVPTSADDARSVIYFYMESGIPAIVSLLLPDRSKGDLHAVVAIGHTLCSNPCAKASRYAKKTFPSRSYRSSDFVPAFIVQDDSRGAYRALSVMPRSQLSTKQKKKLKGIASTLDPMDLASFDRHGVIAVLKSADGYDEEIGFLGDIIVALPPWVSLDALDAEAGAVNYMKALETKAKAGKLRGRLCSGLSSSPLII